LRGQSARVANGVRNTPIGRSAYVVVVTSG
jgi:hypothetical protein